MVVRKTKETVKYIQLHNEEMTSSSGMLGSVVYYKLTSVSEVITASIIRAWSRQVSRVFTRSETRFYVIRHVFLKRYILSHSYDVCAIT